MPANFFYLSRIGLYFQCPSAQLHFSIPTHSQAIWDLLYNPCSKFWVYLRVSNTAVRRCPYQLGWHFTMCDFPSLVAFSVSCLLLLGEQIQSIVVGSLPTSLWSVLVQLSIYLFICPDDDTKEGVPLLWPVLDFRLRCLSKTCCPKGWLVILLVTVQTLWP